MSNVVELDEIRVAHALADQKAPGDWRRFVEAVARDVVEHLPDVLPWKAAPGVLRLPGATLSAAALSGGLVVGRIDGVLCLFVRQCEQCLAALLSTRLAVPRPLEPRCL